MSSGCAACSTCPGFRSISKTGKFCANCSHNVSKHTGVSNPPESVEPVKSTALPISGSVSSSAPSWTKRKEHAVDESGNLTATRPDDTTHREGATAAENAEGGGRPSIRDKIAKFSGSGGSVPKPAAVLPPKPKPQHTWGAPKPQSVPQPDAVAAAPSVPAAESASSSTAVETDASSRMSLKERISKYQSQGATAAVPVERKVQVEPVAVVEEVQHRRAREKNPLHVPKREKSNSPSRSASGTAQLEQRKSVRDLVAAAAVIKPVAMDRRRPAQERSSTPPATIDADSELQHNQEPEQENIGKVEKTSEEVDASLGELSHVSAN